jgi:asparagine synthase (glutamine-hydrolysing)
MCGIVGIVHPEASLHIEAANTKIKHRGPDSTGYYKGTGIAFGHQRLSIIDLSENGAQPMFSADGRYVMIFNGEIYNHEDFRPALSEKYNFKSSSDTETILYGFIEYGKSFFVKLNGIFALSIFDTQTKDLIIVRDQFGIKPLYYYHKENTLLFGSEIKAFTDFPNFDKSLDYEALVNYLNFLWSPGEKTPFEFVKKLLPGHLMQLNLENAGHIKIEKYYEIPFTGQYSTKTEAELIDELDELLLKAVKRQLLADVPVGFFLSGGLDSSAIVAMAKRIMPEKRLKCYTIDIGSNGADADGFADDLPYAKRVAEHLDVDLEIIKVTPDIAKEFDRLIYHLDEPQADPAPINLLYICEKARADGNIVLLGGSAGDDVFSGYRRHQAIYIEDKFFKYIPSFALKLGKKVSYLLNVKYPMVRRARKLLKDSHLSKLERYANYFSWLPLPQIKGLFNKNILEKIKDYNPNNYLIDNLKNNIPNEENALNQMLYWELKYFLVDHNLNYTDKMSMATGIEVRVPFLDIELVEFSTKIPPTLKMKGKTTKYLLKKVMERYLPLDIIYRPKSGFGAPVREWVTKDLRSVTDEYLNQEIIEKRAIFDFQAVEQLKKDNINGKIDASYSVWSLLAMEAWFKNFLD